MRFLSPLWLLALIPVGFLLVLSLLAMRHSPGRLSPARRRLFLVLRLCASVLLVLGLAGAALARFTDRLSVFFVLDQSRSVTADQRAQAVGAIDAVRHGLGRGDTAALVRFGADAQLETIPATTAVDTEGGTVDGTATDIAGALQFALAQAESGSSPRIVLLTDGNENRGSAEAAAQVARSLGARIFSVPLGGTVGAAAPPAGSSGPGAPVEVSVEDVRAPARVRQDEPQELSVMVRSRTGVRARVSLFRDGTPLASREVPLSPGENAVAFTGSFADRGLHAWDALVDARGDAIPQNNHARRFVEVTGPPRVLYVSAPGKASASFLSALASQGISVDRRAVADLPGTLAGYLPYDSLVLDDAPGYGISNEKMETIARYVQDTGGGLLMIGGENSFGAGGYYKTPIERALPVDMDVKSEVQLPRLSLVILVDKSGSMGGTVATGETKLDVVKSAALSAIESLNPFDTVGLLAFDADWEWAVPMTSAGDSAGIASQLAALAPGGGTVMYPALQEAERVLAASASPLKHVIILTDGLTNTGDFPGLVKQMAAERITVSTVAIGEDADSDLLKQLATLGGGRTYATNDPRDVPRIFMTETSLVSRGLLVEKGFLPREVSAGEMLRGIDTSALPGLQGFVLSYAKQGAETVLSALYDAPLLAAWRYGLGRTAAFTSDVRGRWSRSWLAWDQFPRFAAQLVRWTERPAGSDVLHPRLTVENGKATVAIDAYDAAGAFVDGLAVSGAVIGPDGDRTAITVPQVGPGLYRAAFDANRVGDYMLSLSAVGSGAAETGASAGAAAPAPAPLTVGLSVPYSDEYRMLGVNQSLLARLSAQTGGRVVTSVNDADLRAILQREPGQAGVADTAWRLFLLAGLILFFLDIVVRRVVVPEGLGAKVAARLRGLRPVAGPGYEDLAGLVKKAREEERQKLRQRIAGQSREGALDSDLAAYLYIARLHSKRAEKEEKGR